MKDGDLMSSKKNQINYEQFFNDLINIISSSSETDHSSLVESLEAYGYGYEELVNEGISFINDLEREYKFSCAKNKQRHYESLKDAVKNKFEGTKEELLGALR